MGSKSNSSFVITNPIFNQPTAFHWVKYYFSTPASGIQGHKFWIQTNFHNTQRKFAKIYAHSFNRVFHPSKKNLKVWKHIQESKLVRWRWEWRCYFCYSQSHSTGSGGEGCPALAFIACLHYARVSYFSVFALYCFCILVFSMYFYRNVVVLYLHCIYLCCSQVEVVERNVLSVCWCLYCICVLFLLY